MGRRPLSKTKSVCFAIRIPADVREKLDVQAYMLGIPVTTLCRHVLCEYSDEYVKVHQEELESLKKQKIADLEAKLLKLKGEHA